MSSAKNVLRRSRSARRLLCLALVAALPSSVRAQTIDDGLLAPGKSLFTGVFYGHDTWSEYWEGTLKRDNQNVGTLTTDNVTWLANYGVGSRLNLIAMLPYVSTGSSGGTLHPQSGLQDLTFVAKLRFFEAHPGATRVVRGFAVASFAFPVSDYVADLLPLSIGSQSNRLSGRLTGHYREDFGLFVDATAAYTFRGNVTLDRPSYFTDGQLFLTDQVEMPDVFDYTVRAGYMGHGFMIPVSFTRQLTQGGGDIRRQDMPFVSNKMNYSRIDGMARYTLKKPADLAFQVGVSRVLTGRNVGDSTTIGAGILYTLRFSR